MGAVKAEPLTKILFLPSHSSVGQKFSLATFCKIVAALRHMITVTAKEIMLFFSYSLFYKASYTRHMSVRVYCVYTDTRGKRGTGPK